MVLPQTEAIINVYLFPLNLQYTSLPAPPVQHHVPSVSAEVTPPMPPCLASQANQAPMPTEPTRLVEKFTTATSLPCEPVQLAEKLSTNTMPAAPMSLADRFARHEESPTEPMQLMQKFGMDNKMPAAPSFGENQILFTSL